MSTVEEAPQAPRAFRDRRLVAARLALIDEPHVKPLNDLVRAVRASRAGDESIPWFDPDGGGTQGRILFLAQDPGPKATVTRGGSGFISPDNNDASAENTFLCRDAAGVDRRCMVHWNIVPWYLGKKPSPSDLISAQPWLEQLLDLMGQPVVMLVGKSAQEGWGRLPPAAVDGVLTVPCPHPSPLNVNPRPHVRGEIIAAYEKAAQMAGCEV